MEDCPKPIEIKDIKNKEKKFEIKCNNNKLFNVCFLNQGNYLLINTYYNDEFNKFVFEKKYNLSDIQNVKLFTLYSSIDECLDEIFEGIDSGKCNIIEETNYIILIVPLMNKKYNEIKFRIDEKEKNDKEKYEELYKFSINMKNENSFYKNEINVLKDEIKNLKLKFEILEKKFNEHINEKIKDNNWIDSNILYNINDKIKLKNWISDLNIKSKILYRFSTVGEEIKKFHELCDNINNNLIIIQTYNNYIFGAYCNWSWDTSGRDLKDGNGFIYSITLNKKYEYNNGDYHKGCNDHGPYIHNNFYFYQTMKKCVVLNNGLFNMNGTFDIKEIEIYQILF